MRSTPEVATVTSRNDIRVLMVDDHIVVREGLAMLLARAGIQVVAQAATVREAMAAYQEYQPTLTVMDLALPDRSGLEAIAMLLALDAAARIVVLSATGSEHDIYRSLRAGAKAYLLKSMQAADLIGAIRAVACGERWMSKAICSKFAAYLEWSVLTRREREVLQRIAQGRRNHEIGVDLGIAEGTVKTYVKNVLAKLGAESRTQAVALAIQRGLLHNEDFAD